MINSQASISLLLLPTAFSFNKPTSAPTNLHLAKSGKSLEPQNLRQSGSGFRALRQRRRLNLKLSDKACPKHQPSSILRGTNTDAHRNHISEGIARTTYSIPAGRSQRGASICRKESEAQRGLHSFAHRPVQYPRQ